MTRINATTIALATAAVLSLAASALAQQAQQPPAQHQHATADQAKAGDMTAKCQAMMAQREQMMTEMKAADQRLDGLVAKMNSATGQAKVDATAAAVAELVAQRKSMHERMMTMQHGMMGHMADHVQAGAGSMASCPMMKHMGGADKK